MNRTILACLALAALGSGCARTAYDRGRSALADGDWNTAVTQFEASIAAGQRVAEAHRERAAALLVASDFDGALAELQQAQEAGLDGPRLYWLLGQTYTRLDRPADAATAYRAYEQLTSRRSVRKQVRLRIAQLENEVAAAAADQRLARMHDGEAPPNASVAVYSFSPQNAEQPSLADQKICRALNIWVSTDLAKVDRLQVIAADQLEVIYAEQGFTYEQRQMFHPSSLVATGNVQPARHMVRGLYGSLVGDAIVMGAACYDAATDSTGACSGLEGEQPDLFDLETQLVFDILASMDITPTAEERIAIGEKPTRNMQAFLAFADGVYLRDLGSFADAADAFEQAALIDPGFSMAKDAAAKAQVEALGNAPIAVDAPLVPSPAGDRAQRSATMLGLGLIPDGQDGDAQIGTTDNLLTTRGSATLRVDATAGGR
jgi:tetratricopeptide (TPR) repeat protein